MKTAQLKTDLHNFIDQIQDSTLLQAVHTILAKQLAAESDFWDELTAEQQKDIEAGLADLEAGRKKSFTEALDKYK
jgi:predicted transcriptional regulator